MKKALSLALSSVLALALVLPCGYTATSVLAAETSDFEALFDTLPYKGFELADEEFATDQSLQNGKNSASKKMFGDVDSDGLVRAADILCLLNDLAGNGQDSSINTTFSDVNFDSNIDMLDLVTLERHVAGWTGYETLPFGADVYVGQEDYMPDILYYEPISDYGGFAYETLTENQKAFYRDIVTAAENMDDSILRSNLSSLNELLLCYFAVRFDHPEYFWLSQEYGYSTSAPYRLVLRYNCTEQEKTNREAEIKDSLQEIVDYVGDTDYSDYEIELMVHDYLANKITYNRSAAQTGNINLYPNAWNVYGALVLDSSVCEGYAESFMMIMQMFGVKTGIAIGDVHMWNYILLDDEFYYVDVTWDDYDSGGIDYQHFNITYEEISSSRSFYPLYKYASLNNITSGLFNIYTPICTATKYNYLRYNSTVLSNKNTIVTDIANGLLAKATEAYEKGITSLDVMFYVEKSSGIDAFLQSENILDAIDLANSGLRYFRIRGKSVLVNQAKTLITISVDLI